jgi:hypothetical protein
MRFEESSRLSQSSSSSSSSSSSQSQECDDDDDDIISPFDDAADDGGEGNVADVDVINALMRQLNGDGGDGDGDGDGDNDSDGDILASAMIGDNNNGGGCGVYSADDLHRILRAALRKQKSRLKGRYEKVLDAQLTQQVSLKCD